MLGALLFSTILGAAPVSPVVEEFLPRVVKVMGLPMPRPVKVKVISREEAETLLRRQATNPRNQLLGEALLAVGLLPAGTKLESLAPDFDRQNVSGFYDLPQHTLFLLADQTEEAQRPIIAHELAHAVQDANVDLAAALAARANSEDATLAFMAVLEGQAQATAAQVMDGWLRDQHVAVDGMAGLLSDTNARSAADAAEHAPVPWLGLQLRFPYVAGRALIEAKSTPADPIARDLLRHPPASTAQVLDSAVLAPLERPLHLERLIPGAKPSLATTVGRANLELLGAGLGEGWRGDRLESVHVKGTVVVVWAVAFDSLAQATQFAASVKTCPVTREESFVAVLCGVPPPFEAAVRTAALQLFTKPR